MALAGGLLKVFMEMLVRFILHANCHFPTLNQTCQNADGSLTGQFFQTYFNLGRIPKRNLWQLVE